MVPVGISPSHCSGVHQRTSISTTDDDMIRVDLIPISCIWGGPRMCLCLSREPPIIKSLSPQNIASLSQFSFMAMSSHHLLPTFIVVADSVAFRSPITISTSCLGVVSTSRCSCSSLDSSSAPLVGAYTWVTASFAKHELKRALIVLSLTECHFNRVFLTSFSSA